MDRTRSRVALPLLFLVSGLAALAAVPDPASHFGHPIGVDKQLLDWDKVVSYFNLLAKNSDRIQVREIGKTADLSLIHISEPTRP